MIIRKTQLKVQLCVWNFPAPVWLSSIKVYFQDLFLEMFGVINVMIGSREFFVHMKHLHVAAHHGSGPNQTLTCDNKERNVWLFAGMLESRLLLADTRLYSSLLHCSSAQLDSEDQWCTRNHWGKCLLGVPCKREAKALLPLAEGWWTTTASGRHP